MWACGTCVARGHCAACACSIFVVSCCGMGAAVAQSPDQCPYIPHLKHAPGGPGCVRAICWSGT